MTLDGSFAARMLLAAALGSHGMELPVYTARHTVDAIRIDGQLDEASWALSPRVGEFRSIHDPTRRPKFATEAAVVWDANSMYVAFGCTDAEPWGRMTRRDDRLWEEEVVEIFLDPDGDGQNYVELEVSPNNVVVDLLIRRPRPALPEAIRWDIAGLQTAVTRHDAGWVAEIAIPWTSLSDAGAAGPPKEGERWRAGLYRIKRPGGPSKAERIAALVAELKVASPERKPDIERKLAALRSDDEYLAWSVTRPDRGFHDPERFGYLQFSR